MEEKIRQVVTKELKTLGAGEVPFVVEWPQDLAHGDFAVNAAMAASKTLNKSPREIAELLVPALTKELGTDVSNVSIAGPGFINITLSQQGIQKLLIPAWKEPEGWGRGSVRAGERVMVEYSNPNPFKEMHIGHLMSTVIGESVSRLMEFSGAHVLRDTYGGDVGPHVAKTLWALQEKGIETPSTAREIGEAYAHGSRAYEESESAKSAIDTLNTELYNALAKELNEQNDGDRSLLSLWRVGRDVSVAAYTDLWSTLGSHFDYVFFESETTPIGKRIVQDALTKGVFEESEGAVIYKGEKKGFHTLVFITSRGTPTYEAKDIGLAFLKEERAETDYSYIVTAAEQIGHFQVFLSALEEIAPILANKTKHIAHGLLRLSSGKMSSREGNVITAQAFISNILEETNKKNEDPIVSKQVALGAIKYMILRQQAGSDITFDTERSLSLDGDSGPYLQYALVRATTILSQMESTKEGSSFETPDQPYLISRWIIRFPEVVAKAQELQAPHVVTQYLTTLASEFNSFYAQERIRGGEYEAHKLQILEAFVATMKNGLWVLGISAPDKM
jgi:arginyl-tRNA synthetase